MTDEQTQKKFLYLNRKAPFGTIYALESLEVVLIGAAFEQDVSLAFIDDGVFQLMNNQDATAAGMKTFSKIYRALGDYEVRKLYVEKESLDLRGLTLDDLMPDHLRGRGRELRRKALDHRRRPGGNGEADRRARCRSELLRPCSCPLLHTVNKSPYERNALKSCLDHVSRRRPHPADRGWRARGAQGRRLRPGARRRETRLRHLCAGPRPCRARRRRRAISPRESKPSITAASSISPPTPRASAPGFEF